MSETFPSKSARAPEISGLSAVLSAYVAHAWPKSANDRGSRSASPAQDLRRLASRRVRVRKRTDQADRPRGRRLAARHRQGVGRQRARRRGRGGVPPEIRIAVDDNEITVEERDRASRPRRWRSSPITPCACRAARLMRVRPAARKATRCKRLSPCRSRSPEPTARPWSSKAEASRTPSTSPSIRCARFHAWKLRSGRLR